MRLTILVGIGAAMVIGLCGAPVLSGAESASHASSVAPAVIVFSGGTWHLVSHIEMKDGSVVYTKIGETPRAIPDYKVDWRRTAEVNLALKELAEICRTDRLDLGWIKRLEGRSGEIFVAAANRTMPGCLDGVRERYHATETAARERARQEDMSGLANSETAEKLNRADQVVMDNSSVAAAARQIEGVKKPEKVRPDHLAEYADRAPGVIAEECQKPSARGTPGYQLCVDRQTVALHRLERRTADSTPTNVFLDIRDHCSKEWFRDYEKRDHCETDEMGAFRAVQRLISDSRFDEVALERIHAECERTWSTSYTMQEGCIEERVEAILQD